MAEKAYPRAELVISALAPFLTVAGILVGVSQFQAEQRKTTMREYDLIARRDSLEFNRELWQEQLAAYRSLVTTAGEIASATSDRARFDTAVQEFEKLYWGLVAFVGDSAVERQMIDFRTQIYDYRRGMSSPDDVKVRADMLIAAARQSLRAGLNQLNQAR